MCGIAGIYSPSRKVPIADAILKKMLGRMWYRGPDESGIYLNQNIALGNVRLSVIDVKSGQQPLSTPDKHNWIVMNGEIYNYIEIRKLLIESGHRFLTESDTEVLLHAYLEFGDKCLTMLNGQFAFAIWKNKERELFLARDRVGICPFFYTWQDNTLIFGSEIKAILEYPGIRTEFDYVSLSQVFTYWTTLPSRTMFKGIYELRPGHYLRLSPSGSILKQFWNLRFPSAPNEYFQGSIHEAGSYLKDILTDAVRLRLRADVPVAAYLSGGLDSSTTTALIKDITSENLQTFSINFQESEYDEFDYQKEVSAFLNTRHTSFSCTNNDIGRHFPEVIWHAETPILRTAPVPMFCLSKKVRENNTKVIITGEGSDEMLGGYDIFKEAIIRQFWSRQPNSKYRPLLFNKLYPYLAQFQNRNKFMHKFFFGYRLEDTESPFYSHLLRWKNTSSILNYCSETIRSQIFKDPMYSDVNEILDERFNTWGRLEKAQWLEIILFMSGYLLASQGDRMSMANSIEGRFPFLDHRVIEFSATLPPDFKIHGLNEKYILKRIMGKRLPSSILKRPKQAYRAPIASCFFNSGNHAYVEELLSENGLKKTNLFSPQPVKMLISKIKENKVITEIDNMVLAGILSTQLFYHEYFTGSYNKPDIPELNNCLIQCD